eukprot:294814-Alexandrium_andersonii.AAC.1
MPPSRRKSRPVIARGERSTCYAVAARTPTSRRPARATCWNSPRASNGGLSGLPSAPSCYLAAVPLTEASC